MVIPIDSARLKEIKEFLHNKIHEPIWIIQDGKAGIRYDRSGIFEILNQDGKITVTKFNLVEALQACPLVYLKEK